MLNTVYQRADAKNQMLNTVLQKNTCQNQIQRNVNMIYQVYQHSKKVMKYKKTKEESDLLSAQAI